MSGQLSMEETFGDSIESFGEPHLACVLLLDTSGSMFGSAIESLNEGIRRFKEQVLSDPVASRRVDMAIVTFNDEVEIVSNFVSVRNMPTPELQAFGRTEMAGGIQTAIDLVKQRTLMYAQMGTPCHKPWIFMITDGKATSSNREMTQAAERICLEESKGNYGHLTFWALGTGSYDSEQMFSLTNRVMELRDQNFSGIFDWLSDSMSTISQSRVGETVSFEPLPDNARKVQRDRAIDDGWY